MGPTEDTPDPTYLKYWLRNYGSQSISQKVNGILFAKPTDEKYVIEYKGVIYQVLVEGVGLYNLSIVLNLNFGHTASMMVLPYGGLIEIDSERQKLSFVKD